MKRKIKRIAAALGLAVALGGTALAQMIQTIPNNMGGYNMYGPGGMTQVIPNNMGGYNSYGPGGNFAQTIPNNMGGYNIYPRMQPAQPQVNPYAPPLMPYQFNR